MVHEIDPNSIYQNIGVTPVINAAGPITMFGGTKLRPEVHSAMNAASQTMIDLHQLNDKAGEILASYAGAEAGMVTSGSAGALILQAAAVVAGSDKKKMLKLPNTEGMRNEIIIHNIHRFPYDQCYLSVGAKFVEIGDGRRCQPWELEGAFTENTAAVAYLFSPFITRRALPFEYVCETAHSKGIPVIVDAASYLPPRANITRFIKEGADMVIYSGGKGIRGPQGTGVLCGRADLIEAAYANASPHQFIGRGLKVAKEEIIGLSKALEIFIDEDEDEENRRYQNMCDQVIDALIEIPGINIETKFDSYDYLIPTAVITFDPDRKGLSRDQVWEQMIASKPSIYLSNLGTPDELAVDPFNIADSELEIVIDRLQELLVQN
mgnify:CR=1 FL=1